MKKKLLRFLNLRTEEEYRQAQDVLIKKVENVIRQKDNRFNKLIADLKKDGVDVDRHLTVFEKPFDLSDWDTSKILKVNHKMFSDISKTPFEKELEGVEFKHSGIEENNIKGKLKMLYNSNRTEESEKTFNDLLDKLNVEE